MFSDQHLSLGNGNWEMSQRLKEVAFSLGITQPLYFKDRQLFEGGEKAGLGRR